MSPNFDAQHHYGVQGAEFVFATGVELTVGGNMAGIGVRCGELKLSMPKAVIGKEEPNPICFAKLTGGVSMVVECEFFIKKKGKILPPLITHNDVKLLSISSLRVQKIPFDKVDGFAGFRSHTIRLKIMIDSPREYFADLPTPQNVLFLNNDTFDILDHILNIYQSLLTNLPIRRGALFNEVVTHKKPKLSRVVRMVQLNTKFKPLVLSFVLQAEDKGAEYLGFRIRSKQASLNALFQQYTVKDIPEVGQIKAEKKPVAKWIRVENSVSFVDLEARVLSNSDEKAFSLESVDDLAEWIFSEDYAFKNSPRIGLLPCLWSPRLDFTRQQISTAKADSRPQIFSMQSTFLKQRQGEIETLISRNQHKIDMLQSRSNLFFENDNDTNIKELKHLVDIAKDLNAKKDVIFKELEKCRVSLTSKDRKDGANYRPEPIFDSNYIVHNVRILWNGNIN